MLIVIYGLPGTGKSYFARHLEKETGAYYLNTDMIREKIDKKGKYDIKSKQEVYGKLMQQAKEELIKGSDVIADGTFHKNSRRKEFADIARETGHRIFFIEMKSDETTIKKRLEKKRKYSEADFEVYKQLKKEFETQPEVNLKLWSDSQTVDEMITKTKKLIYG